MKRRHWKMAKRVWTLAAAFVLAFPGQVSAEVTPEGNVRNGTDVPDSNRKSRAAVGKQETAHREYCRNGGNRV